MNYEKKISKHLIIDLFLLIIVVVILFLCGLQIISRYEEYASIGYVLCSVGVVILIGAFIHYEYMEKEVRRCLLDAGFEQSRLQKDLLDELPVPYVLTDPEGNVIWYNSSFQKMVGSKITKKNINQIFSGLYKKTFPVKGGKKEMLIRHENSQFRVECRSIYMNLSERFSDKEQAETVNVFYFFDVTRVLAFQEESKKKSLVAGLIYIDNFEEVLEGMEEVRQSLLLALVERKIVKHMQSFGAIVKKLEKDKFFFVFEEQNLEKMMETKFSLLDEVRAIKVGNDFSMTLSISVGVNAPSYLEAYESARIAMDIALGRGGDQAVVRDGDSLSYYGGKTQKVEKSTRVKARMKAHALREIILSHDKIFIMGHKNPDADCIGAALGIYRLAKTLDKKAYIVCNEDWPGIEPIVSGLRLVKKEGEEDIFLSNEQAILLKDKDSALVVVDVNVPAMTECPELLKSISTIVVLDHHRQGGEIIRNAVLYYVEPFASSACEMVTEIIQYVSDKPKLRPIEADALYSGILIDTNNFVIRAGVRTFEAAAYLRRVGADVTRVRKMFREDMEHSRVRARVVSNAEVFLEEFALSTLEAGELSGASIVGAKAANELLNVQNIRASFVLTHIGDTTYVSARSIDDVNVQVIMEKLGGGGHLTMAAAQLKNRNLNEALHTMKDLLVTMREEKDL